MLWCWFCCARCPMPLGCVDVDVSTVWVVGDDFLTLGDVESLVVVYVEVCVLVCVCFTVADLEVCEYVDRCHVLFSRVLVEDGDDFVECVASSGLFCPLVDAAVVSGEPGCDFV